MPNDKDEDKQIERRRAKLELGLPNEAELCRLLAGDRDEMTMRESAWYIKGYVAGFNKAAGESAP